MERFKILKIEKQKENGESWLSVLIDDKKEKISFWLDCGLIDGYGNRENYKTKDLYIDWDFNQYIFYLYDENDLKAKEWQENGENIDDLQYFIDDKNDDLLKYFLESGEK